jgi:hypothetical protein
MAAAIQQRWNFYSPNHDVNDAFALAQIGRVLDEGKLLLKGVTYESQ